MLERRSIQEPQPVADTAEPLTPAYVYDVLKRRVLYFAVPFLLILGIGSAITVLLPAQYFSSGTILVEAQEIPTDLVRPTVAALANDRIQVIQQRIMTRDNLLALAKKFHLSPGWREKLSGTEIVDFIRNRTAIEPADDLKLRNKKKNAIAYTVGFQYEQPDTAAKVANELVTMILKEDVRSRTDFASETTRFIATEVKRLEGQLRANDEKISAFNQARINSLTDSNQLDSAKELTTLRAQLLLLSATYSSAHPDIVALKKKIKALEKAGVKPDIQTSQTNADGSTVTQPLGLDALLAQRETLKEELNRASQKLSAAHLGENLERGQHSERLEVIEQPTLPTKPVSPNRPKIFAVVIALAVMAGAGLALGTEKLDQSIYCRADLGSLVESQLIVSIPYISTIAEKRRNKIRKITVTASILIAMVAVATTIYFLVPNSDIFFYKLMAKLSG
jgi:uncharacterized protein involved in exopolysaccharide biosynthesis